MSKKGSILLVDDDKDDQQLILDILENCGIKNKVVCLSNGEDALEYLLQMKNAPFLILCDVNMPLMNGIELRQRITDNELLRKKSIPFIFLTTTASPSAVKDAYEMSVQGFFEKGSDIKSFQELIKLIYNYWQHCKHPNI